MTFSLILKHFVRSLCLKSSYFTKTLKIVFNHFRDPNPRFRHPGGCFWRYHFLSFRSQKQWLKMYKNPFSGLFCSRQSFWRKQPPCSQLKKRINRERERTLWVRESRLCNSPVCPFKIFRYFRMLLEGMVVQISQLLCMLCELDCSTKYICVGMALWSYQKIKILCS